MKILKSIFSLIIDIKIYFIFFLFTFSFKILANENNFEFNIVGNYNTDKEVILTIIDEIPDDISEEFSNYLLNALNNTGLFQEIKISLKDNKYNINVIEYPVIQKIYFEGNERIKDEELIVVKGFYKNTLNQELIDKLNPTKAAVIYVDCDLYSSTVDVLKFIKHFLQPGTILIFDDWNCFYGDKNRGQKKAFYEFLNLNKDLVFEEFTTDCEAKSFVYINNKNEAQFK